MCPSIQLRCKHFDIVVTRRPMELNKKDANILALVQRCKHFDICIRGMCSIHRITRLITKMYVAQVM
ncbi:hypothetical protein Hanom_Chr08g00708641 [Helianthus anomalus]